MLNLLKKSQKDSYTLLSIGERGSGKTVFLTSIYKYLQNQKDNTQSSLIEVNYSDPETQQNLENILHYVETTGEYPPATLKITNFDFSFQDNSVNSTLVRWWDFPGETCKLNNIAFLNMIVNSDGCCLFLDAFDLVHHPKKLKTLLSPVKSLAQISDFNGLDYPMAIILTKCDLLAGNPQKWQQLEKKLKPLKTFLETHRINYQLFYSQIPLITQEGKTHLKIAPYAAKSVLWLVREAQKAYPQVSVNYDSNQTQTTLFHYLQPRLNSIPEVGLSPLPRRENNWIKGLFWNRLTPLVNRAAKLTRS